MDRRPCLHLHMLIPLLPFGSVVGAACCRAGRALTRQDRVGGNEAVRVDTTEVGRVGAPEAGRVGSTEVRR